MDSSRAAHARSPADPAFCLADLHFFGPFAITNGVSATPPAERFGGIEREQGRLGQALEQALGAGVQTALGTHTARVDRLDDDAVTLTVTEGKHRMVRRMLANSGHPVVTLTRLRMGAVTLADLPVGEWRELTEDELAWCGSLLDPA